MANVQRVPQLVINIYVYLYSTSTAFNKHEILAVCVICKCAQTNSTSRNERSDSHYYYTENNRCLWLAYLSVAEWSQLSFIHSALQ